MTFALGYFTGTAMTLFACSILIVLVKAYNRLKDK